MSKIYAFPELKHEVFNGRVLCVPCHKKAETWGYGTTKIINNITYV